MARVFEEPVNKSHRSSAWPERASRKGDDGGSNPSGGSVISFHQSSKTVMRLHGSSDDLIYVIDDDGNKEEYHPSARRDDALKSVFAVGMFYVFAYYDGIWRFSIRIQREGDTIPDDVKIRTRQFHHYSMELVIESDERNFHVTPVDLDQVSF